MPPRRPDQPLEIRPLALGDEAAFTAGLADWADGERDWYTLVWEPGMTHADHVQTLENERRGIGLPAGRVPHCSLYGFLDGAIVGRCSVRHRLTAKLRRRGGHIGYAVAPRYRERGFGGQLFRAGLLYLRGLGERAALVTCASSNLPSVRMIERVGGVLGEEARDGAGGERILRFWVDLANVGAGEWRRH